MARCYFCGKHTIVGRNVSHAHNVTRRVFKPNLHKVRIREGNKIKRVYLCTKCLRKAEKIVG